MFLKKVYCFKKCVVVNFVIAIFVVTCQAGGIDIGSFDFQKIEPNDVRAETEFISSAIKNNFDKIKTWQGSFSFKRTDYFRGAVAASELKKSVGVQPVKDPNELVRIAESTTNFKLDLEKNLFFRERDRPHPFEYKDLDNSCSYESKMGPYEVTIINTPEHEIRYYPYTRDKDGVTTSRLARKSQSRYPFPWSYASEDPRTLFYIVSPPWEFFFRVFEIQDRYLQGTMDSAYDMILEKAQSAAGVMYRFQLILPDSGEVAEDIIFDGAKGFNVIYVKQILEGKKAFEISRDFVLKNGIFLPLEQRLITYDDDGLLRYVEEFTLGGDMQVNTAIPADVFSILNLGLVDGDVYVDGLENKRYKVDGDVFVDELENKKYKYDAKSRSLERIED